MDKGRKRQEKRSGQIDQSLAAGEQAEKEQRAEEQPKGFEVPVKGKGALRAHQEEGPHLGAEQGGPMAHRQIGDKRRNVASDTWIAGTEGWRTERLRKNPGRLEHPFIGSNFVRR